MKSKNNTKYKDAKRTITGFINAHGAANNRCGSDSRQCRRRSNHSHWPSLVLRAGTLAFVVLIWIRVGALLDLLN